MKIQSRNFIVIAFSVLLWVGLVQAQTVEMPNLRVEQLAGTDLVEIYYDLDLQCDSVKVSLEILDGTDTVPSISAVGAIGGGVTNKASGLKISWNAAEDWGDWKGSTNMTFTLTAIAEMPNGGDATAINWASINSRWIKNFYGDDVVTISDRDTSLMWLYDADLKGNGDWEDAKSRCQQFSYAGHTDWFLPNQDQLTGMYSQKNIFKDVQSSFYWSSTFEIYVYAWAFNMETGAWESKHTSSDLYIWPCRVQESSESLDPPSGSISISGIRVDTASELSDCNTNGVYDVDEDFNRNGAPDAFEDFNGNGAPDSFEDFDGNNIPDAFDDFNGNGAPDAFEDFNGDGKPDLLEDFDGNGIPDAFKDFNGNGMLDAFEDFNGNGSPDALEDFNGNEIPDAFEDFNGNGAPDAFEDFNGNGTPDAFEDFNGNSTPDAFEDFNGNSTPDAFEDFNKNGAPDTFEFKTSNVPFNSNNNTYGAMEVLVVDKANPAKPINGNKTYHGSSFRIDWESYITSHTEADGVLYRIDHNPSARLEIDDYDGYVDRCSITNFVDLEFTSNGWYYVHLAPILSVDGSIDRDNETVVRIMRNAAAPFVQSTTHPNQYQWFGTSIVTLEFLASHIDGESVSNIYYAWDHNMKTIPSMNSCSRTNYTRTFMFQPEGVYYFHIRTEDFAGSLSETAHFRVNIGAEVDTDGDGFSDDDELNVYGTDPAKADTDGDGLNDAEEYYVAGTDPLNFDSDSDSESDGNERFMGFDPMSSSSKLGFTGYLSGDTYKLSFMTSLGRQFIIESKDSLTDEEWVERLRFDGTGGPFILNDPSLTTNRFYRIRVRGN